MKGYMPATKSRLPKRARDKCYDCGSPYVGFHTKLCDFAPKRFRVLPAQRGTQHWTGQFRQPGRYCSTCGGGLFPSEETLCCYCGGGY
jgi:hypothetical protein